MKKSDKPIPIYKNGHGIRELIEQLQPFVRLSLKYHAYLSRGSRCVRSKFSASFNEEN